MNAIVTRRLITPKWTGAIKYSPSTSKRLFSSRIPDTYSNRTKALYGIIGANVVVFLAWLNANTTGNYQLAAFMNRNFTLSANGVLNHGRIHTLITATFSHKDFYHLLFNMLALFSFGVNSIHILGLPQFFLLYLGGGLISSGCQMLWPKVIPDHWPAKRNFNPYVPSLGASGAVNAVVAWNILTFPHTKIYFYGILPIPAMLFGLGYMASDAYSLYQGNSHFGNAAHLGGAAFGAAMFLFTRRTSSFRRF